MASERTYQDVYNELTEEQKQFLYAWVAEVMNDPTPENEEPFSDQEREIWCTFTTEQREFAFLSIGVARYQAIMERNNNNAKSNHDDDATEEVGEQDG